MSSHFVSGGTLPGDSSTSPTSPPQREPHANPASSSAWETAQRHLEAQRQQREAARKAALDPSGGEKSLYDILQENKAAKQAAFEEANKLRNQFRALDDDEVDFLDGVLDRERLEQERVKRETEEGLKRFQEARKHVVAEEARPEGVEEEVLDEWSAHPTAGRKRKREKEGMIKGLKRRSSSGVKEESHGATGSAKKTADPLTETLGAKREAKKEESSTLEDPTTTTTTKSEEVHKSEAERPTTQKPKGGLVDYGSSDDDDDD